MLRLYVRLRLSTIERGGVLPRADAERRHEHGEGILCLPTLPETLQVFETCSLIFAQTERVLTR